MFCMKNATRPADFACLGCSLLTVPLWPLQFVLMLFVHKENWDALSLIRITSEYVRDQIHPE